MTAPKLAPTLEHFRTLPARVQDDDYSQRLRREFSRVVAYVGHKQAADELGTQESTLSHMIAGRGQRYLRLEWALWALRSDPTLGFAQALVEPAGLLAKKAPHVTVEESLLGLLAVIARNFPQLADRLMAEAHQEALAEASKRRGQ